MFLGFSEAFPVVFSWGFHMAWTSRGEETTESVFEFFSLGGGGHDVRKFQFSKNSNPLLRVVSWNL